MASNPADAQDGRRRKRPRTQAPNLSQSTHHQVSMPLTSVVPAAVDAPMIAYVQRVSADNRRVFSDAIPVAPASPVKQARREAIQAYQQRRRDDQETLENERYQMQDLQDAPEEAEEAIVILRCSNGYSHIAIHSFERFYGARDDVVSTRHAPAATVPARPKFDVETATEGACTARNAAQLLTAGARCIVLRSGPALTLRYILSECGLRVQFGHVDGQRCPNPRRGRDDFVVMADNGIHDVAADFWRLLPHRRPRLCSSSPRGLVSLYHNLSPHRRNVVLFGVLPNPLSPWEDLRIRLLRRAETLTNGAGIKPPDRYKVFLRVARQYRHIMMLKRGGRGHDRQGVLGTALGELAIRCPVCPRPDVNLPEGWQDATPEDRFLYTFFVALDACFRLKRRLISSLAKDPPSGPAWAYMTELVSYERFLASVTEQDDVTLAYANMDWVFFSLLQHICCLLWMVVSYDIVCQWTKKIMERVKNLEPMLRIRVIWALVRFVIPKLHILGHTDGEGIERPWSMIGGVAASTRASGPGSRADQLDDHWGFWNWRKTIGLPGLLRRRVDKANIELATQEEALAAFTREQAEFVPEWKRMIEEWEEDNDKPNPYEPTTSTGLSERAVREQFEEEEAEAEAAGTRRIHDVGPTERPDSRWPSASAGSTAMKINLRRARKRLNKNIARLRGMQATYTPAALRELDALALPQDTLAERVPLYPPSGTGPRLKGRTEAARMASSKSNDNSATLSAGQPWRGAATRSRTLIARNESKILLQSDKYQSARAALLRIAGERTGDTGGDAASAGEPAATRGEDVRGVAWPVLRKEDIRYLDDSDEGSWMPDDDEVFTVGGTDRTGRAGGE
ncbi:CxC2 domain-containing protein [Mycena kentingensis (nom. inval.)]|nr:CxC2 domain-containing protein [Mycena kentingensis (nom. inval.)]